MAYSKLKKICFILLCCIVIIFPFWCVRGLCSEPEEINFSIVENAILSTSMVINPNDNYDLYYLELKKGYTYHITIYCESDINRIAYSNSIEIGSPIYSLSNLVNGNTFNITINGDNANYFIFDYSLPNSFTPNYTIYREPNNVMISTVDLLTRDVGINSFWNIFDISINYIVVVVLVAFGIFIITRIIKRISKGKEGL